ncbi:MAG: hypothetical protein ABWY25_02135 [Paenisporosarcina sp.]
MFRNRSVVEIIVILFTIVVSFSIIATGFMVALIEIRDPTTDTSDTVRTLFTSINIILGALLGLFAGKSSGMEKLGVRPDQTQDDLPGPEP